MMNFSDVQAVDFHPPSPPPPIKRNIQQHVINTGSWGFCAQVTRLVLRLEDTFILYPQKTISTNQWQLLTQTYKEAEM